jgi:hypothetical protein
MSENNVAFRLERYDEVCAIAFNRHLSPSSISKRLANSIGNYSHHAPWRLIGDALCRSSIVRWIKVDVKGALSYPPIALAEAGPSTSAATASSAKMAVSPPTTTTSRIGTRASMPSVRHYRDGPQFLPAPAGRALQDRCLPRRLHAKVHPASHVWLGCRGVRPAG